MSIRPLTPEDYDFISPKLDDWWGGRPVRQLLPRLFFEHFSDTSFVVQHGQSVAAFLVGFKSLSQPSIAYLHFIGVAPEFRKHGYGRMLLTKFMRKASELECAEIRSITAPTNLGSIAFHHSLGFELPLGNGWQGDLPIHLHHAGDGQHRILFRKPLANTQNRLSAPSIGSKT